MEWVIIDLETTGVDHRNDQIIEIGAVLINEKGRTEEFQTLVNPGISLPYVIMELTGITDEMLEGQPSIDDVIPDLLDFMGDAIPIAHNASFEAGFLRRYLGLENEEWLDTIILAKIAFPTLGSYSLANLVTALELTNDAPHRALADAKATVLLFQAAEKVFASMDRGVVAALIEILAPSYPIYSEYFQRFEPDTLAQRFLPPYTKPEKIDDVIPEEEPYEIDLGKLRNYFGASLGLGKFIEDYQPRESQIEMAEKVGEAFNDGSFLLAEAGTGTGKTIAYLIPSAMMSLEGGFRVVLSTHTIHLQDQIINKDIPDINRLFGGRLKSTLVKGRSHYLCYRRWAAAFTDSEKDNAAFMAHILPWVVETEDGDGDFLNLNARERREWQKFSATGDTCLRGHCPYYRNKCFVYRTRRKAEQSHLVVINHSLLLTDSMTAGGTLPPSDYLVIDEAHQLDKVAEENLGYTFSYFDHLSLHNDLRRTLQKLLKMAAFPGLFSKDEEMEALKEREDELKSLLNDFDERVAKGDEMFIALKNSYYQFHQSKNPVSKTWRVDRRVRENHLWQETETLLENYHLSLSELSKGLRRMAMEFENELNDDGNEREKYQISYLLCKLDEGLNAIYYFLRGESENMVAWLEEGNERMLYPILRLAPIKVNEILAENLFASKESIIFVSATLSVNRKFQYFKNNCGLDLIDKPCTDLLLPSPFDYEHRALLVAAKDLPLVTSVSEYEYLDKIADAVIRLTTASNGRSLVLFTSHVQLREVFRRIEKPLSEKGITALAHEISGNRTSLLEAIRENSKTVILGANSFWEGIDIAGDNLSLLIIVKLPFWPPDMPTIAAKLEQMEAERRNSFMELSLPQAVIRFKQGFGRLIRKEDDRGVICVLDRRIYEKRYGSQFINSLPVKKLYPLTVEEIAGIIEKKL